MPRFDTLNSKVVHKIFNSPEYRPVKWVLARLVNKMEHFYDKVMLYGKD